MTRITTTIPDEVDEEMRKAIVELVGLKNFHGNITKFIAFSIIHLITDIERDEKLKAKLIKALGTRVQTA